LPHARRQAINRAATWIRALSPTSRAWGGSETPDQLARLEALGCPQAQGYLFSRPVPAGEIVELLDAQPAAPRPLRRKSA